MISVSKGTKARELVMPIMNMEIRGRYQLSKATPFRITEGPRRTRATATIRREIRVRYLVAKNLFY
jgi:hypothetical protein